MGSLPSLESRTWPLSSFSVYSILTDEPCSTAGLDWAPAGAAARRTHSATRVPRKRMAHPPSSNVVRCEQFSQLTPTPVEAPILRRIGREGDGSAPSSELSI